MQTNFSKVVTYTPEWNGNKEDTTPFKVQMKVAEMGPLLELVEAFQEAGLVIEGKVDTDALPSDSVKPILDTFGTMLPEHCTIEGLIGSDGDAVTIQDVVKYGHFITLAAELLGKLAEISSPSSEDEKN